MWYVIHVMSGHEEQINKRCRELMDSDIYENIFVPKRRTYKRYEGAWHKDEKVLFPGYLFVVTENINKVYESLRKIPEYTKVLGTGDDICPVSEEEVSFLTSVMNEDYVVEESVGFLIGDEVKIESGPLGGLEGKIQYINRHKREAVIGVDLFGRVSKMTVALEVVKRVE